MELQPIGNKETQIRLKLQKDGKPVWDQTVIAGLGFWPRRAFLGEVKRNQTKDQDDQAAQDDAIHARYP